MASSRYIWRGQMENTAARDRANNAETSHGIVRAVLIALPQDEHVTSLIGYLFFRTSCND
eukprot:gene3230-6389_t